MKDFLEPSKFEERSIVGNLVFAIRIVLPFAVLLAGMVFYLAFVDWKMSLPSSLLVSCGVVIVILAIAITRVLGIWTRAHIQRNRK